jgi:hypothetical protein
LIRVKLLIKKITFRLKLGTESDQERNQSKWWVFNVRSSRYRLQSELRMGEIFIVVS